uniref:HPt domain-containing protein n=1 Tax=Chromera velia CCMP2878 TaxID=1169474 RepID=A0A0G4IAF0_9ALVE|eukprot:Cvel_12512.t1-p1 / transcript=Cvel_12512.t1 / gene=Cvel_12512 / organism=Chromera_velia_CCMP2878 / gene_product=hypothetical protein / transcript_product=hypothetical protein / location=Cvel_scaffold821:24510-27883(-) / protein_length=120 / sequence_SO=supercontig / SO=protein_coding / is_pseudo=false
MSGKHFNMQKGADVMGGGPDGEMMHKMMLSKFGEEITSKRAALEAAMAAKDWPKMRSEFHSLKGSSSYVAADIIHDLCQRGQFTIDKKEGDWEAEALKLANEFIAISEEALKELASIDFS